jgi:sarcosine oxidase subunit beta
MARHGVDYELISADRVRAMVPELDIGTPCALAPGEGGKRLPVLAGAWHPDAGIARHDAVAWGYAPRCRCARCRHHPGLRGHRLRA